MKILMCESQSWSQLDESFISKAEIEQLILYAGEEAASVLGYDSTYINVVFKPNLPYVRKTTGVGGSAFDAEMLDMTFDPKLPFGVDKFKEYLRDGMFHEINHVVHYAYQPKVEDIMFWVVAEGLAVVFERIAAGAYHPWNEYENNKIMMNWLNDLRFAKDPNSEKWYTNHPDGRHNIAYKTGAWLVDKAMKNSHKSIQELTKTNYKDIIALAQL